MDVGTRIKRRRMELDWSQRDLAAKMGYKNNSTIARIEAGEVEITQSRIVQFADVLGVTIAYLMGWEEEIKKDPVALAEKHIEILMDEEFVGLFYKYKALDAKQRKVVRNLIDSLSDTND